MKNYTDIEQSKKLSEILPLESSDAFYPWRELMKDYDSIYVPGKMLVSDLEEYDICAWSLAALLDILPEYNLQRTDWGNKTEYKIVVTTDEDNYASKNYDNPLDACYELILKLNKLNLCDYGRKNTKRGA